MIRLCVASAIVALLSQSVPGVTSRLQVIVRTPPVAVTVMITGPTSNPTYDAGTSASVDLAGTASSLRGISPPCSWTNSFGGSGSTSGGISWTATVSLTVGTNVITVSCSESGGGKGSDTITVTRSSGAECPALPSFPDANCTGYVHTGVSLTPSGGFTASTNGATYDSLDVTGCITVTANNVTIKRSRINCNGSSAIYTGDSNTGLVVEDVEINCSGGPGCTGITWRNYTARRVNVYGGENLTWAETNVLIEESYLHDPVPHDTAGCPLEPGPNCHTDSVQVPGGSSNVTVRHNRIYGGYIDASHFGNSAFTTGGGVVNFLVEDNLFAGGGFSARCEGGGGNTTYRVINNRFSRIFVSTVGGFGPQNECNTNATTYSGNVYDDTGLPI